MPIYYKLKGATIQLITAEVINVTISASPHTNISDCTVHKIHDYFHIRLHLHNSNQINVFHSIILGNNFLKETGPER